MNHYCIQIKGHLDLRWQILFEGFTLKRSYTQDGQPCTTLTGAVEDPADLYGILSRLRDINAELISLQPASTEPSEGA